MPTISNFYGITIIMNQKEREHNPPHVHAVMQDCVSPFSIQTGELLNGEFPPKAKKLVKEFILSHRAELEEMWESGNIRKLPPVE